MSNVCKQSNVDDFQIEKKYRTDRVAEINEALVIKNKNPL